MRKNLSYILLLISGIIFVFDLLNKIYYSPDDTYIYLQYARNIARGYGFSFNAGEPSYGVTGPLWAMIVSIPYLIGAEGYWFAKIIDLLFALLSMFMFYKLAKEILKDSEDKKLLSIFAVSVFILNVWFIRWAFTGMETSLAVFTVLTIFYEYLRGRYKISFFLSGVFYLIRPEAAVLIALLTVHYYFKTKNLKSLFVNVLLALIPIIPFLIYAWFAFGTLVPNTAIGKTSFNFGFTVYYLQLKRIFQTIALSNGIELVLSIIFIAYIFLKKKLKDNLLLPLWIGGVLILYLVTDSDIISRYLLILIPVFTLIAVKFISYTKINKALITIALFTVIAVQSQSVFFVYVKPSLDSFTEGIDTCFKEIARWLDINTAEDSKVLVSDVGVIGYYSNRYIIDAAALVNHDLKLNEKIMAVPPEKRDLTYNLLLYIPHVDYVVQRDKNPMPVEVELPGNTLLNAQVTKIFPGLGISDPSPKWYKVYSIAKH